MCMNERAHTHTHTHTPHEVCGISAILQLKGCEA